MLVETKRCTKCGDEKSLADFYRHATNLDGRFGHCKVCHAVSTKQWLLRNPDKRRASEIRNREKTREQRAIYAQLIYLAFPEEQAERQRRRWENNRETMLIYGQLRKLANYERYKPTFNRASRRWYFENRERLAPAYREQGLKASREIQDCYVRELIRTQFPLLKGTDLPLELIEAKRAFIRNQRALKEAK